jgi:hypothetical protein
MSPDAALQIVELTVWEGVTIRISYDPDWSSLSDLLGPKHQIAHIVLEVLDPVGAPIPVTDTGYRSHFARPQEVAAAGGPVPFVRSWLDCEARWPAWQRTLAAWRQLDLFG